MEFSQIFPRCLFKVIAPRCVETDSSVSEVNLTWRFTEPGRLVWQKSPRFRLPSFSFLASSNGEARKGKRGISKIRSIRIVDSAWPMVHRLFGYEWKSARNHILSCLSSPQSLRNFFRGSLTPSITLRSRWYLRWDSELAYHTTDFITIRLYSLNLSSKRLDG